ncbi:hypothetical protein Fmac_000203 [Flemingia macrophylla]|uniref:Uncharacterized protein n=1 Tax=Flemingia macrophylla TaxID=520843 RepID=A0ABD1NF73_9FABA
MTSAPSLSENSSTRNSPLPNCDFSAFTIAPFRTWPSASTLPTHGSCYPANDPVWLRRSSSVCGVFRRGLVAHE